MNPRKLTDAQFYALIADRRDGLTFVAIGRKYDIKPSTASHIYHGKVRCYPPVPPEPEFVADYTPLPPTKREILTAQRLKQEIAAKRAGLAFPVWKRTMSEVWAALEDIERRAKARREAA